MDFPDIISFTVTNACNLRCHMCGQWSEEGYINNRVRDPGAHMTLADWKGLVDEAAAHKIAFILIRGGEPFLYPGLIELMEYIRRKDIFIALDTNGTLLENYAADLIRIGKLHITFSVDGPEEIHDAVRGVKGSFKKTQENIARLHALEKDLQQKISQSICFTISQYSYRGLGQMPEVARQLGIGAINIVPYYYFPAEVGQQYEKELREYFNCTAFSWKGFHHDLSGVDLEVFRQEHQKYLATLGEIYNDPFMPMRPEDYAAWFKDAQTPVGSQVCMNVERLIDIQPDGEANFCVDFPDYSLGNVKAASLQELWNGPRASQFRDYRRKNPFAICYRCGAKYCAAVRE